MSAVFGHVLLVKGTQVHRIAGIRTEQMHRARTGKGQAQGRGKGTRIIGFWDVWGSYRRL